MEVAEKKMGIPFHAKGSVVDEVRQQIYLLASIVFEIFDLKSVEEDLTESENFFIVNQQPA